MVQTATWTAYQVPESLPPDTEESMVSTEWHQEAIGALADMLRDVADRRGVPWGICEQVGLSGLRYASVRAQARTRCIQAISPTPMLSGSKAVSAAELTARNALLAGRSAY